MKDNPVLKAIYSRRSIRKYTKEPIKEELIKEIINAGMYAPSAVNKQPWHFIVFKNTQSIQKITKVHPNAKMLADADCGILICGDKNLAHSEEYMYLDCSAATQNMLLAAHSLNLGAVWLGIHPRVERKKTVSEIFNLPENIVPVSIISLGHSAETKATTERFKPERIHNEQW